VIKFVSDLQQVGGFLWVPKFPPPIKLTPTIYTLNIVECGAKHHKPSIFYPMKIYTVPYNDVLLQQLILFVRHGFFFNYKDA